MSNKKEVWRPWPEARFASTFEVSSRGRVRSVERKAKDKNGRVVNYRERELFVAPDRAVSLGRTRRSVPKAVLALFGKLPVKWR